MNFIKTYAIFFLGIALLGCNEKKEYTDNIYTKPEIVKDPAINFLSPEESMETMHLPEGYDIELVASEPMINEPVTIAWGPNGKLYVAEMLTYMQDIDGTNQNEPWSRVSVLEDLDGDGKMDKSTVFIDSLILPRILLPLDNRVIVGETYNRSLYSYKDTNGDNIADVKELILEEPKRDNANLEHQSASMLWSIDNWLYVSSKSLRYRFTKREMEIDTLSDAPNGQWGLTEDENGQLFYSSAGGEVPALGYQQHPVYGNLEMPGKWEEGFEAVWPIIGTPDVQGGEFRLREDGTLNHFTASCGQSIFLGDQLPAYGDLFIPEPVGRLVRRAKVEHINGKTVLRNAYPQTEFLASTDANFRPVETKTGPDGCLYVVDMYRGIIQEGTWVRKGSFLRPVVERKKLDRNIGKGRIYRIVHKEMKPTKMEPLLEKSSDELIDYLAHPNGWYRINAQKLLVLRNDKASIPILVGKVTGGTPHLGALFTSTDYALGRLHSLWTLEGMDALDTGLVIKAMQDEDARVRMAALRISDRYIKDKNAEVFAAVKSLQNDPVVEVKEQLILTLRSSKTKEAKQIAQALMDSNQNNEVITAMAKQNIEEVPLEVEKLKKQYVLEHASVRGRILSGYQIFKNVCSACHGMDGKGIEGLAPTLVGSPRVNAKNHEIPLKILMNGLTGPIDGKEYSGVMVGMKEQDNQWMADILTYIRLHLNDASAVGPWQNMEKVRKEVENRESYWTIEELMKSN
ncbi:cytochrome c-containing protein [Formosa agariphila KMM 3901]|uniref:Cytochrome c-containing protein n=1 Tax=Formosa agariphila (strain DSM 15362 / KCTC 12365 / LMG 23005 / KMM 3901 / M-2Alg 35-1) TaxID=1347342 RepID=T2KM94_FORAG|nr:c-type cytochrome [Formosa agariphila]CDF79825.1 cytochrome c-containing protein [Formosa agariphila KMM 3901]